MCQLSFWSDDMLLDVVQLFKSHGMYVVKFSRKIVHTFKNYGTCLTRCYGLMEEGTRKHTVKNDTTVI